ncbi:helix-turn-helix transcriptional regulator [Streptomyces sp. GQFP]|uniref:helix-turn-helix transcriptional regulator n=1 Tax=Streptomyces sp. GQFP TaxID=2907545 RepID=UPI001F2455A2|nr:LuxR C-terminal-related transcriptional regulator [Streptomyces sp. GQFP]UIX35139.1 LuxR C-terminal-related transcriptional regulator [Streptomyces sp. GQFP]
MPEGAETIYLALLDRHTATTAELASQTGRTVKAASELLDWLRAHGLVLRANVLAKTGDPHAGWTAANPDRSLRGLVLKHEEALLQVRGSLPSLQERYLRSRQADDAHSVIEQLETWGDVGNRYHELLRDARDEVLMWDMAPYTAGQGGPVEQSALDRGVRFRQLCDPQGLSAEVKAKRAAVRGLQARIHAELPFKGAIADGAAAVITMDHEPQNAKALLVRRSPLLDALLMLFETSWSRAVPMDRDDTGLGKEEWEVMTLLAAGWKDEAIARQTEITTRTVRRRVQTLLTALHAKSRFHAGVEASRRGWV